MSLWRSLVSRSPVVHRGLVLSLRCSSAALFAALRTWPGCRCAAFWLGGVRVVGPRGLDIDPMWTTCRASETSPKKSQKPALTVAGLGAMSWVPHSFWPQCLQNLRNQPSQFLASNSHSLRSQSQRNPDSGGRLLRLRARLLERAPQREERRERQEARGGPAPRACPAACSGGAEYGRSPFLVGTQQEGDGKWGTAHCA